MITKGNVIDHDKQLGMDMAYGIFSDEDRERFREEGYYLYSVEHAETKNAYYDYELWLRRPNGRFHEK